MEHIGCLFVTLSVYYVTKTQQECQNLMRMSFYKEIAEKAKYLFLCRHQNTRQNHNLEYLVNNSNT
jgi:hypothetical protein